MAGVERRLVPPVIPAPGVVDLGQAYRESQIGPLLDELDRELVGLTAVKVKVHEIASLLLVARLREDHHLSSQRPTLHMSFTGRPGTGKTTVARRMAGILHQLGYVGKAEIVVATWEDLSGEAAGRSAARMKDVLERAIGGVLFIDEAHYLYRPANEGDRGREPVELLFHAMESRRDELVVILAGYRERMESFFQSNPGFYSRIGHHVDFPDYSPEELMQIAELMLQREQYYFDGPAREAFKDYLALRAQQPHFANGRSVRNAIDRAKLRQATRILEHGGRMPAAELARIDPADILQSRVFQHEPRSEAAADVTVGRPVSRPTS